MVSPLVNLKRIDFGGRRHVLFHGRCVVEYSLGPRSPRLVGAFREHGFTVFESFSAYSIRHRTVTLIFHLCGDGHFGNRSGRGKHADGNRNGARAPSTPVPSADFSGFLYRRAFVDSLLAYKRHLSRRFRWPSFTIPTSSPTPHACRVSLPSAPIVVPPDLACTSWRCCFRVLLPLERTALFALPIVRRRAFRAF